MSITIVNENAPTPETDPGTSTPCGGSAALLRSGSGLCLPDQSEAESDGAVPGGPSYDRFFTYSGKLQVNLAQMAWSAPFPCPGVALSLVLGLHPMPEGTTLRYIQP